MSTQPTTAPLTPRSASRCAPVLPEAYAYLVREPELTAAWQEEVLIRQAEARKVQLLLDYRERRAAEQQPKHTFSREAVVRAVHREAALMLGVTEHQVRRILTTAETAQKWLPGVWEAYQAGRVDLARVEKVADGAGDLIETNTGKPEVQRELTGALDGKFAQAVVGENPNTLARMVRDTVAELDTAGHQRRYDRAKTKRYVSFIHHDDGMSTLKALLPSVVLGPLEQQLHTTAATAPRKAKNTEGEVQEATYYNRMADTLAAWLTAGVQTCNAESGNGGPRSETKLRAPARAGTGINITIPLATLTGACDAPVVSTDGRFILPAEEARHIANNPEAGNTYYLTGTKTTPEGKQKPVRIVKLGAANPLTGTVPAASSTGADPTDQADNSTAQGVTTELVNQLISNPNLLEAESSAWFVTGNLRTAVLLRDGVCQVHGCTEPGFRSDIDHKTPHKTGGATSAENTQVLCHIHHELKSHQLLPELGAGTDPREQASPEPGPAARERANPAQRTPDPPSDWTRRDTPHEWATGGAA
ncbi:HNH endonuclease [Nesterenkonia ebinurensis]|uniref:HNH endonuclease n=1 Tax=Nesterenkonia ebinurensis TaxID=2608252 RepID=UPI00123D972C|nr:HNH endonuclease signature motif containing protein [Nesterenkonia ebinurensis]